MLWALSLEYKTKLDLASLMAVLGYCHLLQNRVLNIDQNQMKIQSLQERL